MTNKGWHEACCDRMNDETGGPLEKRPLMTPEGQDWPVKCSQDLSQLVNSCHAEVERRVFHAATVAHQITTAASLALDSEAAAVTATAVVAVQEVAAFCLHWRWLK